MKRKGWLKVYEGRELRGPHWARTQSFVCCLIALLALPISRWSLFLCSTVQSTHPKSGILLSAPPSITLPPTLRKSFKISDSILMMCDLFKIHILNFFLITSQAPAKAEVEMAYLDRTGAFDMVMMSNSDIFLFGGAHVIRRYAHHSCLTIFDPLQPSFAVCKIPLIVIVSRSTLQRLAPSF